MDISDLPHPDLSQFEQYGTGRRARKIYIGREFLKFRYYDNPTEDMPLTKQNYVNAFFEQVTEVETAFRQLHINQNTLTEVAISLHRNHSEAAAEQCLTEALGESPIIVQPITGTVFQSTKEEFVRDTNKEPNFGEYLDYATMQEAEIEHILTWDSDFCQFSNTITMLPHGMWNI